MINLKIMNPHTKQAYTSSFDTKDAGACYGVRVKEAELYKKLSKQRVQCQNCAHYCVIEKGKRGICGVRENINGKLFSLNYGKAIACNIDPIEKKPLFHFLPGTQSLSIATVGCNFKCANCFLPGTYIITQKGPITINRIFGSGKDSQYRNDGSIMRHINPHQTITHKGNYQKITHGFKHPFVGEIIKIKPRYTPEIICTPSHEFFATRNPLKESIKKIRVENLNKDYYLAVPKKYFFPKKEQILDIKETLSVALGKRYKKKTKITKKDAEEILRLSKNGMTSREIGRIYCLHPAYVRTLRSKLKKGKIFFPLKDIILIEKNNEIKFTNEKGNIPRFIKTDENFAKLLGYYCSEGCVYQDKNRPNSYSLIFTFGDKEEKLVKEVENLIKEIFGIESRIEKRKSTIAITVGKTSLAILFEILCGTSAKNKNIPSIINNSPKNVVNTFLKSYIAGDGCYIKNNAISINTVSKNLALGIYWLWLKMGFLPSFYEWNPPQKTKIENRIVNQSTLYYVKLKAQKFREQFLFPNKKIPISNQSQKSVRFLENDNYWFIPLWKIAKEKYSGWVYNIEVEKEHSYLANFISVGNCQNYDISQMPQLTGKIEGENLPPEKIVRIAKENNLPSISYTYTSPTIFSEYALDTMKLAKKEEIKNVWISNGFWSKELFEIISPYLDAANIDLKAFSDDFYIKYCGGRLQPVLDTLKRIKKYGIWLEVTTLVIPGLSDSKEMFENIANFIKKELGAETPWHISQFSGAISWKLQHLPDTPVDTLKMAYEIGKKAGLKYVYTGNIPGLESENTFCPKCGVLAIERLGYSIKRSDKNGKCAKCGENLDIIT